MKETIALVGDVGGTNLRLALMACGQGEPRILHKATTSTATEATLLAAVQGFLEGCGHARLQQVPEVACLAGAGPVQGQRITLTNAPWDMDAQILEQALGIPVTVINDVTDLGHGLSTMSPRNEEMLLPLPRSNGAQPFPDPNGPMLFVGAGTGLGVGFATRTQGQFQVHASEGGHLGLPITSEETLMLWQHLAAACPGPPGAEAAVSGQGIANIFTFLLETGRCAITPSAQFILDLPEAQRPRAIANGTDPVCRKVMAIFVELYARVCAELAAVLLPSGGIYLCGGIAAKNPGHFLDEGRFMASFERNYREHLNVLARATPVYLVRDTDLALFGAARFATGAHGAPTHAGF